MTITLSPKTQQLLEERMKETDFASPEELIFAALAMLEGERVEDLDIETIAAIERAESQAERGEGMDIDDAFRQIRQRYLSK